MNKNQSHQMCNLCTTKVKAAMPRAKLTCTAGIDTS